MRLHRLNITAFGPFGGTQDVDFDDLSAAGLFLLHGPTGAGKTSVLDAVCYALYGAVPGARQQPGGSLRSDHAAPGTRTEVAPRTHRRPDAGWRSPGSRRWERPKKRGAGTTMEKAQSWLREYDASAGAWKALSRSHQEIGEEIAQLLGMSREQFCQVVLLPQGDFARFLRADAEARGKLLGRLFDTRRFAAVEERLAELRRAAEAEVRGRGRGAARRRAPDAAGRRGRRRAAAARPRARRPGPRRGRPGLGRRRPLHGARSGSPSPAAPVPPPSPRRPPPSAALDDVRELGRLQRRFAEARERAGRLEERADAHRERPGAAGARPQGRGAWRPRWSCAEAAEAEHRRAADAETRARALLPRHLRGRRAGGLAAAARRAAEELGGLESARRAEQRLRRTRRRARRPGPAGARRRGRRCTTPRTGSAAGRRPGRASRRGSSPPRRPPPAPNSSPSSWSPPRTGCAAARRRDTFARDTDEAQTHVLAARERATEAKAHWLDLKEQRLNGIAAELAADLSDGEPCAVCGATEHPAPARKIAGHVDRDAEERALAAYQRADERRTEDERRLGVVREALAAATAEAGDASTGQLAEQAR